MKLDQLTFTRYLAALGVVFFHYGEHVFPANKAGFHAVLTAGPIAVSYFYVLSGFIMAIAYYRPQTKESFPTIRYWLARFARIYPIYLLALLLMVFAKRQGSGSDLSTVLLSVGMLQAWIPGYPLTLNAPGWSLSVEAFFYLCFPLLVFLVKRQQLRPLATVTIALWLLTQIIHTTLLNSSAYQPFSLLHDFIFYFPIMHLNTFLMGFIAGVWLQDHPNQSLVGIQKPLHPLGWVIAITITLLIIREPLTTLTGIKLDYTNGLIAPLFLAIIVLLALDRSYLSQWLRHRWLILLGEASFSLYILQKPLHGIYNTLVPSWIDPQSNLHFYGFLLTLTTVAILSFLYLETPARRFINKFGSSSDKSG